MDVPSVMRGRRSPAATRRGSSTGSCDPPGRCKWMALDPRAGAVAQRPDDRDGDRPAGPTQRRRRPQALRPQHEEDHRPRTSPRSRRWATRTRRGARTASVLAYVRNDRDGAKGMPRIYVYTPATKKASARSRAPATCTRPGRRTASTWRSTQDDARSGRTSSILDAAHGRRAARGSPTTAQLGARRGRRPATRSPSCTSRARSSTCGWSSSRDSAPTWTAGARRRPHHGRRPRQRLATRTGSSRPTSSRRRPPPRRPPAPARPLRAVAVPVVTAPYLERLAARTRRDRHRPVRRRRPRSRRRCRTGFPADARGRRARSRACSSRPSLPYAAAVKPNLAFFEAYGSAGMAALERLRALVPADVPFIADAKRGRHRVHGREAGGGPVRRPGRRRRHGEPVPGRGGDRAAPRARRPLRLRPVPDLQPGCRRSCRASSVAADAAAGHPPSRSGRGSRAASPAWGPGRHRRPRGRRHRPGRAGGDPGARARASRSSCRASARRAGRWRRCSRRARDGRRRRAARPGGGLLVNVSRGIARAALGTGPGRAARRTPASGSRRPPPSGPRRLAVLP